MDNFMTVYNTIQFVFPILIGMMAGVRSWVMSSYAHQEIDEVVFDLMTFRDMNLRWLAILVLAVPVWIFMLIFWVSYFFVSFRFIPDFLFQKRLKHVSEYWRKRFVD